jgi:hypothetical protein
MACIRLRTPEGHTRMVPEGVPYHMAPGEVVIGSSAFCPGDIQPPHPNDSLATLVADLDRELGKGGMGDWIKVFAGPVAKILGKGGCMSCEVRRVVTNAYANLRAKHGTAEALRIMKDLWSESNKPGAKEIDVLHKLQEYLH